MMTMRGYVKGPLPSYDSSEGAEGKKEDWTKDVESNVRNKGSRIDDSLSLRLAVRRETHVVCEESYGEDKDDGVLSSAMSNGSSAGTDSSLTSKTEQERWSDTSKRSSTRTVDAKKLRTSGFASKDENELISPLGEGARARRSCLTSSPEINVKVKRSDLDGVFHKTTNNIHGRMVPVPRPLPTDKKYVPSSPAPLPTRDGPFVVPKPRPKRPSPSPSSSTTMTRARKRSFDDPRVDRATFVKRRRVRVVAKSPRGIGDRRDAVVTSAFQHSMALWKVNKYGEEEQYREYFKNTLQKRYFKRLVLVLKDVIRRSTKTSTKERVKSNFIDLVRFLQGKGEPITPESVYDARQRCIRLFQWYKRIRQRHEWRNELKRHPTILK